MGMNKMYAKNMVVNMGDGEDYNERGQWPSFYEADCSKQNNSWACGAYLMDFIDRAIQAIGKGKGREIRTMHAKIDEILKTRNKLRQILEENMKEELVGNGEMNDKNNFLVKLSHSDGKFLAMNFIFRGAMPEDEVENEMTILHKENHPDKFVEWIPHSLHSSVSSYGVNHNKCYDDKASMIGNHTGLKETWKNVKTVH